MQFLQSFLLSVFSPTVAQSRSFSTRCVFGTVILLPYLSHNQFLPLVVDDTWLVALPSGRSPYPLCEIRILILSDCFSIPSFPQWCFVKAVHSPNNYDNNKIQGNDLCSHDKTFVNGRGNNNYIESMNPYHPRRRLLFEIHI